MADDPRLPQTRVAPDPTFPTSLAGLGGTPRFAVAPVRQSVTDQIRSAIVRLELKPGQRLVERELVDAIGVSRPTIREALQQLAAEGLVSTERGKGWCVHRLTYEEAEELYEIRARLEGMACRRFAERATEGQVVLLREAIMAIEAVVERSGDSLEIVRAKDRFYEVLFDGAGGTAARQIVTGLQARITVFRSTTLTQGGRPQRMIEEMRAIVAAIETRDPDVAERACVRHVREAARVALAVTRKS